MEIMRELEREGEAARPATPTPLSQRHRRQSGEPVRRLRRMATGGHLALGVASLEMTAGALSKRHRKFGKS